MPATTASNGKYSLKIPVLFEGKEITEVTLKRIKGKDLVAIEREILARGVKDSGEMERTLYLLGRCASVPVEAVEEFSSSDITALINTAQDLGFF